MPDPPSGPPPRRTRGPVARPRAGSGHPRAGCPAARGWPASRPGTKSSTKGIAARHPAGQRLVTRGRGERVEPDRAGGSSAGAGRSRGRPAPDRPDPSRPKRPRRPQLLRRTRRAQCWLNSRNDAPMRVPPDQSVTVSATRSRAAVAVAVAQDPGHPGQPRAEDERLGPDGRRRQRLAEAQQDPRVALHRAGDVADDHERARPADGSPPDPVEDVATGRQAAPEHRPRGDDAGRGDGARCGACAAARGCGTSRSMSRSASRSSAAVIRSNWRWRSASEAL